MSKFRLDTELVRRGLVETRSQAENYIKLGYVEVDGKIIKKSGYFINNYQKIKLSKKQQYVGRGGLKLEAANNNFKLNFKNKVVLDVGSSTGGFTDYAHQHGAKKIIAVDVGTGQMHPKLCRSSAVELHEKTDIRDFIPKIRPDIILADLSFISLRQVLPHLAQIAGLKTQLIILFKPQFETKPSQINRGIIKNDRIRREIIKNFENRIKNLFKTVDKMDSQVTGEHGNIERFYHLQKIK
ncbi:TPA: TlyA family rRNA (cytidine-2'-O)-methyltransferase [Candidatus Saccharibacteria bacterium]|nr:MAG: Hemolysin A, nonfunctional [Candidatus Saccharibacteria bacterium GW2011_GWA2_46_10]OGL36297.1 MAG: hypothetical protein A3F05_03225 [Candidatus Saccharibacteria bacterium RIFCSPHIGHO2_12_FULL_47_17]HCM51668.1 TlyA family rRNA (cytidine-2'-O)-methyltransferase [Candidatus Saccharibacteria bacterium]